jgi:UDP-N-acetylmuramate dehydrogenase
MKQAHYTSLKPLNTFGMDGRARRYIEYTSAEELQTFIAAEGGLSPAATLQVGQGSNLLFIGDYDGLLLHAAVKDFRVLREDDEHIFVHVGAGMRWDDVVAAAVETGCYGLENLSYIPGDMGAAAVQNIGAYGSEVADFITEVETVELATGKQRVWSREACGYGYRNSVFKSTVRGAYAVTGVTLQLQRNFRPQLTYGALIREMDACALTPQEMTPQCLRQMIIEVRRRKLPEPEVMGNAGSFFKNPVIPSAQAEELLELYPEMPHYPGADGVKIPAGWLIEQAGWKGRFRGAAGVYEKQALVLVNTGGATGAEVAALSGALISAVRDKFHITIYPEVNFIYQGRMLEDTEAVDVSLSFLSR